MDKIKELSKKYLINNNADCLAVGIIDFKNKYFDSFELEQVANNIIERDNGELYFDLASVSKPLINSVSAFTHKNLLNEDLNLILNHRARIPAWGLLPKKRWKDLILSYPVKESQTLYSDYSANRFMLELEHISKISFRENIAKLWDQETLYWLDRTTQMRSPQYGFIEGVANFTKVHDPNAYNVSEFMSHAGVISTIEGLCRTLLNFNERLNLLEQMIQEISKDNFQNRFVMGWDRAENPDSTIAGSGCSRFTFGHLGFTGTSVWIDPELKRGHVILTNSTKYYWFDKKELPSFRKKVGEIVWQS